MSFNDLDSVTTFQRNVSIPSVIDYIYAGNDLQSLIIDANIEHIKPQWSDHALLSVKLSLSDSQHRPGLWRGNPVYAANKSFQKQLQTKLDQLLLKMSPDFSPQLKWEAVKSTTKQVIKSFGAKYVS
ncbi:hypothetical protein HPULCUR_006267 [Helicostylum pulchrum]|uniref:Endonuclease/exonuclease/phosphatase domain-containing protein n=1 Tax=Helicostylum pulchrum TaxID=562976 RepID=A0ABP9Y2N9_9FUNG